MSEYNLVVIHRGSDYVRDFDEVAGKISAIDPAISVFCIDKSTSHVMPDNAWKRPTLTVALQSTFKANIKRGPLLKNRPILKPGQHKVFVDAGLPTPPTMRFFPGMKLDPILFGEYVVIKPINPTIASYGRGIQLFRRKRLETLTIMDFPRDHFIHSDRDGYIVQRFINTGPFLGVYRVLTLFGVPLYCFLAKDKLPQPTLAGTDDEIERLRVTSNTGNYRVRSMCSDADVLELAVRVGKALPDIPLLGTDIIREEATGRPFVLECNPGGNTWHFSSRLTTAVRQQMGGGSLVGAKKADLIGRQMLIDQFGAFDLAAQVLIDKTRLLAA
jgi:hypothetical protein